MVMPIAWVFNLDADEELRRPEGYVPTAAMLRRIRRYIPSLAELARPGDVILDIPDAGYRDESLQNEGAPAGIAAAKATLRGRFVGQAWCPTPSALTCLGQAGARLPATPSLPVLQRVNHRAFCAQLGQTLEGARFVSTVAQLEEHMSRFPISTWLLKRPFGFSGRSRRRVAFSHLSQADRRWIDASMQEGAGLQAEPWVHRLADFALHGYVDVAGSTHFGQPTLQECDEAGAWIRTRPAGPADLPDDEEELLREAAVASAQALFQAGYFGPFGLDAYRWRDDQGRAHFNPRSEINARYTMGWHIGVGSWRPLVEPGEGT